MWRGFASTSCKTIAKGEAESEALGNKRDAPVR